MPCKKMPCGTNGSNDLGCDSLLEVSTSKKPFNGARDWRSVVDTEDSAFLCSVPTLLLYQMLFNSGTSSDNLQAFCLEKRLKCATLGEIKENEVASQDYYQTQKAPPKVSHLERGAHLRSRFQPSYLIMGGHLQKERRGGLLSPGYRTISHYQNVPGEITATQITGDDFPEQQVNKDDSAALQIQEDDSSEQPFVHEDTEQPFKIEIGDVQELHQKIKTEVDKMDCKVLDFKNRYNGILRPMLVSRGLILPHDLKHPSTLFVHRQTYKILGFNPSYLSSFDITAYECGVREQEWQFFLQHMAKKRVYVVEDWDSTISTVETLMYDHGLKGPEDGTELDFYKGECDASFDNGISTLSCIIWKGDKIIYSAVYKGISCKSPTEAEAYAAFVLLSKASEMMIEKLLICCDCKPICKILSGELSIGMHHQHRNLYLMLRSMKKLFKKLIVMWKPRELMLFVDDLAKASTMSISSPIFPEQSMQRWSHHLNWLPLFRIERTEDTNKIISKFGKCTVDESYAANKDVMFYIEVDDEKKVDCLQGLKQSFKPRKLHVFAKGDKADRFNGEFETIVDSSSAVKWVMMSDDYRTYTNNRRTILSDLVLVVVCDASVPKGAYYNNGAFHVILVTPDERKNLIELDVPELNALSFVYFNGVKFPLNESSADSNWRKGIKDDEDEKLNSRKGRKDDEEKFNREG